jgi:Flp pilus assembly protein TadB
MEALIAILVAAAVVCLGLAIAPLPAATQKLAQPSFFERSVLRNQHQLRGARLVVDPRKFTLVCWISPPLLLIVGLLVGSVVIALGGFLVGLLAPRIYLNALLSAQRRRTEAEAPRILQVILASLVAGRTYLEAITEARSRAHDRWMQDDLDFIIRQFHLDVPLEKAIAEVRSYCVGRNLGLIWDNLAICIANKIPATKAKELLMELSSTVQFNVQVEQEVKAKTSGLRVQIWMLAAIVPALFFYLRFLNPEFFSVLNDTLLGKFVLFPLAAFLEVFGIVLSFRVARVEAY